MIIKLSNDQVIEYFKNRTIFEGDIILFKQSVEKMNNYLLNNQEKITIDYADYLLEYEEYVLDCFDYIQEVKNVEKDLQILQETEN